ncbi:MAG TPA: zinc ribbon domain-containing protein, partial [Mesorhizobium sp.]|nr:zinc ribbon domain-containing protein [Mesorhizobium sp.]
MCADAECARRIRKLGEGRSDPQKGQQQRSTGRHHSAPKHGDALLAGLIRCNRCGRKLTLKYTGAKHGIPRYSCSRA